MLEETPYNTISNFIDFYKTFKKSKLNDLNEFYKSYNPPINRHDHMCVSLAMEIVHRLSVKCPGLNSKLYLVSCEEHVESISKYIFNCNRFNIENAAYSLEKEHLLVAMRIQIAEREGIMLLDPGYHVACAITVMKDERPPHTGRFTQLQGPTFKRDYHYKYNEKDDNFIDWIEHSMCTEHSLIYIKRPFRTAIDVTIRRNLVYNFRSLLARDANGRVFAGVYFCVTEHGDESEFTLFYDRPSEERIKFKVKFNLFKDVKKVILKLFNKFL